MAGCASTGPAPSATLRYPIVGGPPLATPASATRGPVTPIPSGDGVVVGGLYRCFAVPPALSGPPARVAGTVDVFRGPLPGLPDEIVPTTGEYRLDLPPGPYELVGHWAGSLLAPPVARVTVSRGTIIPQNLVYLDCK